MIFSELKTTHDKSNKKDTERATTYEIRQGSAVGPLFFINLSITYIQL